MLVTALNSALPIEGKTASIVYIPEGRHTITPSVNGKPKKVTIAMDAEKGEAVAAGMQSALENRLSANVRPYFDFDHNDVGPAAGLPKRFYYEQGKGLMVELEYTGAGRKAIESKDYSYFSPTFLMDEDGTPAGIPERGPLGALVNEPAFRDIPRIAAREAHPTSKQTDTTMNQLVTCGLLTEAEGAKDDAVSVAQKRITAMRADARKIEALDKQVNTLTDERDQLKQKLKAAEADITKTKEDNADQLITAAVADGRIAAKDEDSKEFWRGSIIAQGESAIKALNALPAKNEGITRPIVTAKQGDKVNEGNHSLIAAADQLIKDGTCKDKSEAIAEVAASNPELYESYRESLGAE